jgi:hypothetical protein
VNIPDHCDRTVNLCRESHASGIANTSGSPKTVGQTAISRPICRLALAEVDGLDLADRDDIGPQPRVMLPRTNQAEALPDEALEIDIGLWGWLQVRQQPALFRQQHV